MFPAIDVEIVRIERNENDYTNPKTYSTIERVKAVKTYEKTVFNDRVERYVKYRMQNIIAVIKEGDIIKEVESNMKYIVTGVHKILLRGVWYTIVEAVEYD